jgi:hypothetical protein
MRQLALALLIAAWSRATSAAPVAEPDPTDDVALILREAKTCTWRLFDARSKATKTVLVTDSCPETAVFDPYNEVTYFLINSDLYQARWSENRATRLASIPNERADARLIIARDTGRVRIGLATDLTTKIVKDGKTFYAFEDKLFPEPPYNSIPVAVEMFDLDDAGAWRRISVTGTDRHFDLDEFRDVPQATPRPGTFSLRTLLLGDDCSRKAVSCQMRTVHRDDPSEARLVKVFPPDAYEPDETTIATIDLDDTHHLVAGTSEMHEVNLASPLVYCKTDDCTTWVRLSGDADRTPLDARTWPARVPVYIGVREHIALVSYKVISGDVAFYSTTKTRPTLHLAASFAAWAPLRGYWAARPGT